MVHMQESPHRQTPYASRSTDLRLDTRKHVNATAEREPSPAHCQRASKAQHTVECEHSPAHGEARAKPSARWSAAKPANTILSQQWGAETLLFKLSKKKFFGDPYLEAFPFHKTEGHDLSKGALGIARAASMCWALLVLWWYRFRFVQTLPQPRDPSGTLPLKLLFY